MCSLEADQKVVKLNMDKMYLDMYPGTFASLKVLRYVPQICAHGSTAGRLMQVMRLPLLE